MLEEGASKTEWGEWGGGGGRRGRCFRVEWRAWGGVGGVYFSVDWEWRRFTYRLNGRGGER